MADFFSKILSWIQGTNIPKQVADVDIVGLFSNPWFLVPFVIMVVYFLYKQSFKDLIIVGIFIAVWWLSGTGYMQSLIVNGEVQVAKVLPVVFGGAVILGFLIYILFGRSD